MIGATKKQKEEFKKKKKPDLFPNKKQKKVANYLGSQHTKTLNKLKGQTIDISQFPEYESLKGSNIFISINDKGKVQSFNKMTSEQLEGKQIDDDLKRVDKKARDLLVTERAKAKVKKIKTKEKLKGIKEDPTLQKNKLEDAYLKYDEAMGNLSEVLGQDETPETPEQRIAYRKKNTAMRNLFDTAKAISGINKTDEYAKAFQYVNEPSLKGEELDSETLYKSEGPIKSLSWKGKQQDEYRTVDAQIPERKNIKDLSDEELIKRLKL